VRLANGRAWSRFSITDLIGAKNYFLGQEIRRALCELLGLRHQLTQAL
jgi:hypothetical protein